MIKRLALAVCLALTFCNNNSGAATETVTLEFPEERAAEFDELVDVGYKYGKQHAKEWKRQIGIL